MPSLQRHEGYLLIDHRNSPGVPADVMIAQGIAPEAGRQDSIFETSTFTCSHCETVVVMNPKRTRSRGYCSKCDHYVCDECEAKRFASGVCLPFKAMVEQTLNQLAKQPQTSEIFHSPVILLP